MAEYIPQQRTLTGVLAGAGEQSAQQLLAGRQAGITAGQIPTNVDSPTSRFNTQLLELLKQYQGLGTQKFQEAGITGQEEQVRRLRQTPSDLIGASPSLQAGVRGAQVEAVQPTVTGAQKLQQTFTEKLQAFGTGLERAQAIGKWMQDTENTQRKEALDLVLKFPSTLKVLPEDQKRALEKKAGLNKGLIDLLPEAEKEGIDKFGEPYTLSSGELVQKNERTGEVKVLSTPKSRGDGEVKSLSGDAAKIFAITQTIVPEINQLKEAFNADYKKSLRGIVGKTDRRLVKLVDNIADKVGRLRSGGAVNKDEEARFKRQIASFLDIPFGKKDDAITALDGVISEAQSVNQSIRPQGFNTEIEIPVKNKATKESGWILENEYDPAIYNRL